MTIWQCRPWFGSAWYGSKGSGLALRMQTYNNLTYFSSKFKKKPHLVLEYIPFVTKLLSFEFPSLKTVSNTTYNMDNCTAGHLTDNCSTCAYAKHVYG